MDVAMVAAGLLAAYIALVAVVLAAMLLPVEYPAWVYTAANLVTAPGLVMFVISIAVYLAALGIILGRPYPWADEDTGA